MEKGWKYGSWLMQRWNIDPVNLVQCIIEGLPFYDARTLARIVWRERVREILEYLPPYWPDKSNPKIMSGWDSSEVLFVNAPITVLRGQLFIEDLNGPSVDQPLVTEQKIDSALSKLIGSWSIGAFPVTFGVAELRDFVHECLFKQDEIEYFETKHPNLLAQAQSSSMDEKHLIAEKAEATIGAVENRKDEPMAALIDIKSSITEDQGQNFFILKGSYWEIGFQGK